MSDSKEQAVLAANTKDDSNNNHITQDEDTHPRKTFFQAALPVFACGAGLFSDGYVGNVRLV